MPRKHDGPWLRKSDLCWYTTVNGKLVRLGGPEDSPEKVRRKYDVIHDNLLTISTLSARFLVAIRSQVKESTRAWYTSYLTSFLIYAPLDERARPREPIGEWAVEEITSSVVYDWINDRYGKAAASTRHTAARAVTRLINWAVDEGLIERSPLRGFRKPPPARREAVVTQAQYVECLKVVGPHVKDLVKFLWHTGCRPQELRVIEARWVHGRKIVLPTDRSKGEKKQRVIYLDSMMGLLARRLSATWPTGTIFRNSDGEPWTKNNLALMFRRLRSRISSDNMCAYAFRHTWITRMLEKGVDVATVAALAGNSPRMIMENYNHVAANEARLLDHLK